MKKTLLSSLLLVATALLVGSGVLAAEARTLEGQYVWDQRGNRGDLKAVFTPSGEGTWDVAFHFDFREKPHVYSGTAAGSLSQGQLKGTVQNEDKQRTFTFSGTFADGTFEGTHAEVEDGEEVKTGTLTLR